MKTILVATDLSPRSERAMRRAFALAEQHQSDLIVLSVVDEDLPREMAEALQTTARAALERLCGSISSYPHETLVEYGDAHDVIEKTARTRDVDLTVMGVHRERAWADLITGSTMERLVRASTRPVLLVKDPVDHAYARAVSGIDFSPSSLSALTIAAQMAPQAQIDTFHAVHVPFRGLVAPAASAAQVAPFIKDAEERLAAWLEAVELPESCDRPDLLVGDIGEVLRQKLADPGADLIVVGAHGRSRFTASRLGSFTQSLLRSPPCDILVARG